MSNGNDGQQGNGNDWQQGPDQGGGAGHTPGGGGQFGPSGAGTGGAGGGAQPPGGGGTSTDLITEGWGGSPEVTLDEVVARLKLVFRRATGPVLIAWLGIAVITLLFSLLGSAFYIVDYFVAAPGVSSAMRMLHGIFEVAQQPIFYAVGALQLALFRPLHRQIFEGEGAVAGPMGAVRDAWGIFLYMLAVLLILSLGSGLGTFCCIIPGLLIAFLFCQAPYLTATQGLDPISALKRSFELNKTYYMVILALVVGIFGVSVVGGCIAGVATWILGLMTSFLRPFHSPFMAIVTWLGFQLAIFGAFMVQAAIFSVIETKETGRMPVE